MAKSTGIAWCDSTFNAWVGCQKVSPGCKFCYAERETFVRRQRSKGFDLWGPFGLRHRTAENYWHQPVVWNNEEWIQCQECGWRGAWGIKFGAACQSCGSRNVKDTRQRVFCMSLGDVLEDLPALVDWRRDLVDLIDSTSNLDWLLLSKRVELAQELLPTSWFNGVWPANVWIGTSVEDQVWANERIPELIKIPAPIKFLSIEPLLEAIDIRYPTELAPNWVIVGGESGPKCRPFEWDWARVIRDHCVEAGIPFFMKQGGGYPDKRDNLDAIPEDLRIRSWPK